jgi:hypothetical protein
VEPSDVRRRLRAAIDEAKRHSTERRARVDAASRAWEEALPATVVPAFHALSQALAAEGHRFKVLTPGESARLSVERSAEEFVELALDTARDVPAVMLRSTRGRGRRIISSERVAAEGGAIAQLTQEAVVGFLLEELIPFIEL